MRIERDDLTRPAVVALVEHHLRGMHASSPACHVFALDLTGLQHPDVTVWTIWDDDDLLGMGALKRIDDRHGELKSMRTAPTALRRGVAWTMLDHLIAEGRARRYRRLSLETGNNEPFAPARAMYRRAGFAECGPFADYDDVGFSKYFTLEL